MIEGSERRSHWGRNLAICAIVISLPVAAYLYATREWEENELADIRWQTSGHARVFQCLLTNAEGRPISGARVDIDTNSGWTGAHTDENGHVEFKPGELDVGAIAVNRVWIVRRNFAYWLNSPSVEHGLDVRIRLKDLAAFGLTNVHASSSSASVSDRDRTNVTSMMAE